MSHVISIIILHIRCLTATHSLMSGGGLRLAVPCDAGGDFARNITPKHKKQKYRLSDSEGCASGFLTFRYQINHQEAWRQELALRVLWN